MPCSEFVFAMARIFMHCFHKVHQILRVKNYLTDSEKVYIWGWGILNIVA